MGLPRPSSLAVKVWSESGKEKDIQSLAAGKGDGIAQESFPKTLSWHRRLRICKIDTSNVPASEQPASRDRGICREKGKDPGGTHARENSIFILSHERLFISNSGE